MGSAASVKLEQTGCASGLDVWDDGRVESRTSRVSDPEQLAGRLVWRRGPGQADLLAHCGDIQARGRCLTQGRGVEEDLWGRRDTEDPTCALGGETGGASRRGFLPGGEGVV